MAKYGILNNVDERTYNRGQNQKQTHRVSLRRVKGPKSCKNALILIYLNHVGLELGNKVKTRI